MIHQRKHPRIHRSLPVVTIVFCHRIDTTPRPSIMPVTSKERSPSSVNGGPADALTPDQVSLFTCLSAYTDALDALPLDLTRSFSDLRELDAVLGPHVSSLISRISHLTDVVRSASSNAPSTSDPLANLTPGQRLLLVKESAEEARAYKMGGEDKIRVALCTAETILSHTDYIDAILDQLSALPEIKAILEPERRSHTAGELSDGTPITVASANAATLMAGGNGIFANTGAQAQAAAAAAAAAALSGGASGVAGGVFAGATSASGSGTTGTKKQRGAAGTTAGADGSKSSTSAAVGNGAGGAGIASGSSKKRKTAAAADGDTSASFSGKKASGSAASQSNTSSRKKVPTSPAVGSSSSRNRASGAGAGEDLQRSSSSMGGPSSSSRNAGRGGFEAEDADGKAAVPTGTRSRPARNPRSGGAGSSLRRRADASDDEEDDEDGSGGRDQYGYNGEEGGQDGELHDSAEQGRRDGGIYNAAKMEASPSMGGAGAHGSPRPSPSTSNVNSRSRKRGHEDDGGGADTSSSGQRESKSRRQGGRSHGAGAGGGDDEDGSGYDSKGGLGLGQGTSSSSSFSGDGNGRQTSTGHAAGGGGGGGGSGKGSATAGGSAAAAVNSAAEADVDERRYCFCENVSYGDMIGCDDDACPREWFHLECVGLKEPPSGTWFCDDCLERRAKKRGSASSKKIQRTEGKFGGGGTEIGGSKGKSGGRR